MKKPLITLLVLFIIILPTILPFFNSRFFYTQDHIFIARLHQVSAALVDGQFPLRWAPDLRFGEPLFIFYAPLPYYIGALIHLIGLNFIWVAKILFILSSFLSAVTMYLFCSKLFSTKGALISAILYTYAPYRAVDLYVRGALSEAWAFIFFPLIFYASMLVAEKRSFKTSAFLSLSLAGLFLTHNVTTLMFLPFLGLWWIYLFLKEKNWKIFLPLIGSFILGLGIAASFLIPAMFERQFIQTKYLIVGYFNFRAHFIAVKQFFSTFWGYGSSLWGLDDGMSFQVGLIHWAVLTLSIVIGFFNRRSKKILTLLLFLIGSFVLSLFFQHNKSAFIWEAIPTMAFIQFPWRFLAITIFIVSIIGAFIGDYLTKKYRVAYFILIILIVFVNLLYFKPKEYVDNSFFDKFLHVETMRRGVDLTKDYLPIWVQTIDGEMFNTLRTQKGEIDVRSFERKSTKVESSLNINKDSLIEAPITYFPGWEVLANEKVITQSSPSKMGLIRFELPKQEGIKIKIEFRDTPARIIGNAISLICLILVFGLFFLKKEKRI